MFGMFLFLIKLVNILFLFIIHKENLNYKSLNLYNLKLQHPMDSKKTEQTKAASGWAPAAKEITQEDAEEAYRMNIYSRLKWGIDNK